MIPAPTRSLASVKSPFGVSIDDLIKRLSLTHARHTFRELAAHAGQEGWPHEQFLNRLFRDELAHRAQARHAAGATETTLDELLMRLNLASAPHVWRSLVVRAGQESWSHAELLRRLLGEEVAFRDRSRLSRMVNRARFPFVKTIDQFDFSTYSATLFPVFREACMAREFVAEGRCMVLTGKAGRGKTHLAIAAAHRAIQNGFEARFSTAGEISALVSRASREGRTRAALPAYLRPDVLVVDDVGESACSGEAAEALFVVIDERYRRRRATIIATRRPLHTWHQVLDHPALAAAVAGWMCERGCLLEVDSPALAGGDNEPEPVRTTDDGVGPALAAIAIAAGPAAGKDAAVAKAGAASKRALDQRLWPRAELSVEVGLTTDSNFYTGFSADISEGGVFVGTYAPLSIGAHVVVALVLPGSTAEIRMTCRVCWARPYNDAVDAPPGTGLLFLDLGDAAGDAIRRFVGSRDPIFWA